MTVSVRMEPVLEKQLELAAKRKGVTKSQFIVDAVRHALGHTNPYELLLQVKAEATPQVRDGEAGYLGDLSDPDATREYIQQKLRKKHGLDAG